MNIKFKEMLTEPHFFKHFQQLYFALGVLKMYDELWFIDLHVDEMRIEYDEEHNLHALIHECREFDDTKAICYINDEEYSTKAYMPFIIESLKEAWAEYLI